MTAAGNFCVAHNIAGDLPVALQAWNWTPADCDGTATGGYDHISWRTRDGYKGEEVIMTQSISSILTWAHEYNLPKGSMSIVSLLTKSDVPNMFTAATLNL